MGSARRFVLAVSLTAATMLFAPATGAASQLIGSDLSDNLLNTDCGATAATCTDSFGATPILGDAPFDGVITSWTVRQSTGAPQPMTLRVLRFISGTTYLGVRSAPPDLFTAVGDSTVTFPTRLSIGAGERIGYDHSSSIHQCVSGPGPAQQARWNPPLGDGEQRATMGFPGGGCETPIQALVEPDADHDGFGDESQDQCPTNPAVQGTCPPNPAGNPASPINPAGNLRKRKCKKKQKAGAEIAKKKKCKKKKKR